MLRWELDSLLIRCFIITSVFVFCLSGSGFLDEESWQAFDAGNIGGLSTKGYFGAAFDGQHIYFTPCRTSDFHGIALRYNTDARFTSSRNWESFDAGNIDGLDTKGYAGSVFDGQYIYYVPFSTMDGRHGRVMRYNTESSFTSSSSWEAYDADAIIGLPYSGYTGGCYDGRYVYFTPFGYDPLAHGSALCYDTDGDFRNSDSWMVHDASMTDGLNTRGYYGCCFDGRYVYFVPFHDGTTFHGRVLRYDTDRSFEMASAWDSYDAGTTSGMTTIGYKGAVKSGDYIYFVPFRDNSSRHGRVLRYNTTAEFASSTSWEAFDAGNIDGLVTQGYVGAEAHGDYIYFVPYSGEGNVFHANMLRYNTSMDFNSTESWDAFYAGDIDGLVTKGYKFSASDSQYIYFAPYHNNIDFSGNVLRFKYTDDFAIEEKRTIISSNAITSYTNPFNSEASISYSISQAAQVTLSVYDINGHFIKTLANGPITKGNHTATWNADNLPSGIYLYHLQAGDENISQKVLLIR